MIKVEFIQGSIANDVKICTLVLEYPRSIHAQLLTHRVFSKNSSSSRAVPIKSAIQQIEESPAEFMWTSNQPGMSGDLITDVDELEEINFVKSTMWKAIKQGVLQLGLPSKDSGLNVHKQHAARFLEPFQNIRVVLTSTEWENWDWLRVDVAAQPEIEQLAKLMLEARTNNKYLQLAEGEWHVPFIKREIDPDTAEIIYRHPETDAVLTVKEAIELSMSICAQTSFRKEDYSDEKTETVIDKLFTGKKVHASPSEHQATPIPKFTDYGDNNNEWPEGVTHIDRKHKYWSGNFCGWIQNRQLIPNHDKAKF